MIIRLVIDELTKRLRGCACMIRYATKISCDNSRGKGWMNNYRNGKSIENWSHSAWNPLLSTPMFDYSYIYALPTVIDYLQHESPYTISNMTFPLLPCNFIISHSSRMRRTRDKLPKYFLHQLKVARR